MVQLIAFEINFCAAKMLGQALGKIKRAGATDIMGLQIFQLRGKGIVFLGRFVICLQIEDERHQRFGNKTTAIKSKAALFIGAGSI